MPDAVVTSLAELGTFGVCIPGERGGLGPGKLAICVAGSCVAGVSVIEHSEPARIAAANDAALLEVRLRSKGPLAERQARSWHKHR
ncbi:MAG TPA: hypothetical protein PKZ76_17710 [Xanthomonadaceae bacterium]|jgi:hypothetical protein|nr:hypothetical protein [Xanthomonadaceae bacterium]